MIRSTIILTALILWGVNAYAQSAPVRTVPVAGANLNTDQVHVLVGSNVQLTTEFLVRHTRESNGGSFGDNMIVADFWYDGAHRRIVSRSAQFVDVDDPADIRCGRTPGTFPDQPDYRARLPAGTVVCHIGGVGWSRNGLTAYQSAIQFVTIDEERGAICLSAAPGEPGRTRTGSTYEGNELVCHVALYPDGTLVVGANTDPNQTPIHSVIVRGNLMLEGNLEVGGNVSIGGTVTAKKFIEAP